MRTETLLDTWSNWLQLDPIGCFLSSFLTWSNTLKWESAAKLICSGTDPTGNAQVSNDHTEISEGSCTSQHRPSAVDWLGNSPFPSLLFSFSPLQSTRKAQYSEGLIAISAFLARSSLHLFCTHIWRGQGAGDFYCLTLMVCLLPAAPPGILCPQGSSWSSASLQTDPCP